jgi:hypothetical protein
MRPAQEAETAGIIVIRSDHYNQSSDNSESIFKISTGSRQQPGTMVKNVTGAKPVKATGKKKKSRKALPDNDAVVLADRNVVSWSCRPTFAEKSKMENSLICRYNTELEEKATANLRVKKSVMKKKNKGNGPMEEQTVEDDEPTKFKPTIILGSIDGFFEKKKGACKNYFKAFDSELDENPPVIVGELPIALFGPLLQEIKDKTFLAKVKFVPIIAGRNEDAARIARRKAEFQLAGSYCMFSEGKQSAVDNPMLSNGLVNCLEHVEVLLRNELQLLLKEDRGRSIKFGLVRTEVPVHQGLHVDLQQALIKTNKKEVQGDVCELGKLTMLS